MLLLPGCLSCTGNPGLRWKLILPAAAVALRWTRQENALSARQDPWRTRSRTSYSGISMHINIVTLFPEFFTGPLSCGLMQRALESGILSLSLHNPRDKTTDKHRTADDRPYGGGPGMVMLPGPMAETLRGLGFGPRGSDQPGRLVMLAPKGRPFSQALAREMAALPDAAARMGGRRSLTLICGRYEGLDARIEEYFPVQPVSVGDFVLNGGEAAALCVIEAVARLLPGFMGHEDSGEEESFSAGLLEYPHYTRPEAFEGLSVPEVLRSGDHGRVTLWRRQASLMETLVSRPEMLSEAALSPDDHEFLRGATVERPGRNLYCALVHHPVLDKDKNSIAVSLTNLDIHDIARSSRTYGLGGYYVLTPLADQRELLESIVNHWTQGPGKQGNPDRDAALALVRGGSAVADAVAGIRARTGQEPLIVGTTARLDALGDTVPQVMGFSAIAETLQHRPVLLLFGTGHGLAPELNGVCHAFAPPLRWHGGYNHLSVRSAAAIILDRILGDWR